MATWTPNEDAPIIAGLTNRQVHEHLPHRTIAAIQKRREVLGIRHPRAGEPTPYMPQTRRIGTRAIMRAMTSHSSSACVPARSTKTSPLTGGR
jgi:hypothetical protein